MKKEKADKNFVHTSWTVAITIVGIVARIVDNPKRS